jgi:hypothetical protein
LGVAQEHHGLTLSPRPHQPGVAGTADDGILQTAHDDLVVEPVTAGGDDNMPVLAPPLKNGSALIAALIILESSVAAAPTTSALPRAPNHLTLMAPLNARFQQPVLGVTVETMTRPVSSGVVVSVSQ